MYKGKKDQMETAKFRSIFQSCSGDNDPQSDSEQCDSKRSFRSLDPIMNNYAYIVWALLVTSKVNTALEVKSDFRFGINDPNYLLIHVHIAYTSCIIVWALLATSEATTALEVKSDPIFEICGLNYLLLHVHYCLYDNKVQT